MNIPSESDQRPAAVGEITNTLKAVNENDALWEQIGLTYARALSALTDTGGFSHAEAVTILAHQGTCSAFPKS